MIDIFKLLITTVLLFTGFSCKQFNEIQGIEIGNTLKENITPTELEVLKNEILKVLDLELGSLVKLANFDCGGSAGCYDLGDVMVQLIDSIGEKGTIELLNNEDKKVYRNILGLLSAGLEYGKSFHQSKEVKEVYPYVHAYLQANIRLAKDDEKRPQKYICKSSGYEYIIKDDSKETFIISITDKNKELTYEIIEEDMRPEMGFMDWCTDKYIVLNIPCGGPCYGIRVIFIDQNRASENFQYCKRVPDTDVIVYRKDEVFDTVYVRNLLNRKEVMVKLDNCVNSPFGFKKLCSIDELEYVDGHLIISYYGIDPYIEPQLIDVSGLME